MNENWLYTSDRKGRIYPPPADAALAQHIAFTALEAVGLATTAVGAGLPESYLNALRAYEREYPLPDSAVLPSLDTSEETK